ncbi:MAG: IclR family transcriptional regulator [Anaerolineae bacterium]|jgi:DNA-binding IclR family transcriptional regulator|nr:IclR family transcriptional regulator [Anaerolineae bacterium]
MDETSKTLTRAVQLLDCFTREQPHLGVREAARLAGFSSSTAGRLLASLRQLGLLVQDPETRQYSLAGKVLAWAEVYSASVDVRSLALPYIYDLQRTTGETISLYIMEGAERVCVERLESEQNVRVVARVGRHLPLHAGSAGKLFLAYLPDTERDQILAESELEVFTPYTLTDPDELRRQAALIRGQGFAVSHGEWTIDASGVAAPIFNQRGQMVAALTISGPSQRFQEQQVERYIKSATRTASHISRLLGFSTVQRKPGIQAGRQ